MAKKRAVSPSRNEKSGSLPKTQGRQQRRRNNFYDKMLQPKRTKFRKSTERPNEGYFV